MNKMMMTSVAAVLVGGAAYGAYQTGFATPYADVVSSTPITVKEPLYGQVLAATPIVQTVQASEQVCQDKLVEKRRPERFGDKDGMVAGAIIGGLLGNQVGKGNGRTAATIAGAVGGGYVGREIDRRHEGGQRYTDTERVCHTETHPADKTVGYNVQYSLDGQIGSLRADKKPGDRILLGERDKVIGYDVAWRYKEESGTIRMTDKPGDRLPMKDGAIVIASSQEGGGKG